MNGLGHATPVQAGQAPRIALLHTAQVHVATFDTAFHAIRPEAQLTHEVRPELLDRAIRNGLATVRPEVETTLRAMAHADVVLCTCSTLGPLVDECARTQRNLVRIDRALMMNACRAGTRILVALCLESTRAATLDLLHECASCADKSIEPLVVMCTDAWKYFEAEDLAAYAESIATTIKKLVSNEDPFDCVVLGQASMQVAAVELSDLPIPILTSPKAAVVQCIAIAEEATKS